MQSLIGSLTQVILQISTLTQFEVNCIKAIVYNTSDETGDELFSCSDCHRPQRLSAFLGCPHQGSEGKAQVEDFPGDTCPGWYYAHEETSEILELRALADSYGINLQAEPYIATQILRDLKYLENERLWEIKQKAAAAQKE